VYTRILLGGSGIGFRSEKRDYWGIGRSGMFGLYIWDGVLVFCWLSGRLATVAIFLSRWDGVLGYILLV
jgi:hypothetical protein